MNENFRDTTCKPTILLAEDDAGDQELVRVAFAKIQCEVELQIVGDGCEALDYLCGEGEFANAATPKPDLIILDLNMPRMNGFDLLQTLKNDPKLRAIPVVVFSTSAAQNDINQSYSYGCNTFISKPSDIEDFVAVIRQIWNYWFQMVELPSHQTCCVGNRN